MPDREQIINEFEHEVRKAHGEGWDFIDWTTEDGFKILALLKEQETIIQRLKDIIIFNKMTLPDITNFSEIEKLYKVFSPLNEQRAVKPHTESAVYDIGSWWYVCGACQQPIDKTDIFCRHCGRAVKWE